MSFKNYLKKLAEESAGTTSADIATVDNKLDLVRRAKHLEKGKKCQKHKRLNCKECEDNLEESKWK